MAKGASGIGGGSAGGNSASGAKANNAQMQNVMNLLKQGKMIEAGDAINDDIDTGGYLMYENNGNVTIIGKKWNNGFANLETSAKTMSADGAADFVNQNMNNGGTFSLHKFDGQVQFPASYVAKGRNAGPGLLNAIIIAKQPTNVTMNKILTTPNGKYNVYEIAGTRNDNMFHFVAMEN